VSDIDMCAACNVASPDAMGATVYPYCGGLGATHRPSGARRNLGAYACVACWTAGSTSSIPRDGSG
jgi:hypothetical protein